MNTRTCGPGCESYSFINESTGRCVNDSIIAMVGASCRYGLKTRSPLMEPFHSLTPVERESMIKPFLSIRNSNPASPSGTLEECEFPTP